MDLYRNQATINAQKITSFLVDLYATDQNKLFSNLGKTIEKDLISDLDSLYSTKFDLRDFANNLLQNPERIFDGYTKPDMTKKQNKETISKIESLQNEEFKNFLQREVQNSYKPIEPAQKTTPTAISNSSDKPFDLNKARELLKAYVNSMSDIPSNYESKKLGQDKDRQDLLQARNDAVGNFFTGSKGNYEFDPSKEQNSDDIKADIKNALDALKGFTPQMRERQIESTFFGNNASKQNALSEFRKAYNAYNSENTSSTTVTSDELANREQIDTSLRNQQYQQVQIMKEQQYNELLKLHQEQQRQQTQREELSVRR